MASGCMFLLRFVGFRSDVSGLEASDVEWELYPPHSPPHVCGLQKGGSLCRPILSLGDLGASKASSDSSRLIRQQVAVASAPR